MRSTYLLLLLTFLFACEETITLDVDDSEPIYIIEGLITDENKTHFIRVSQSIDYYANDGSTPVTNAVVTVTDGIRTYSFDHNPSQINETEGFYFSRIAFPGVVGREYNMRVEVDGRVFTATDQIFRVASIDSLSSRINEEEFEDPDVPGYFYEILFYTREPQETEDFYLFKFYRNDTLLQDDINDVYFSNDDLLAENITGIPTAGFYRRFDIGTVEVYSLTSEAFLYYNDLSNLLNSDGGLFGAPPVNPRTNIQGGALGYFQTSAVDSETYQILN